MSVSVRIKFQKENERKASRTRIKAVERFHRKLSDEIKKKVAAPKESVRPY